MLNNRLFKAIFLLVLLLGSATSTLFANSLSPETITQFRQLQANRRMDNLLSNGDFSNGVAFWWDYATASESAAATVSVTNGEMCATITAGGVYAWSIGVGQSNVLIEEGKTYQISFSAYAAEKRTININIGLEGSPWTVYYSAGRSITAEKEQYSSTFTAEYSDQNAVFAFQLGDQGEIDVCVDDVVYEEVYVPPSYVNLLTNEGFNNGKEFWNENFSSEASGSITFSDAACLTVGEGGNTIYDIQLYQAGVQLEAGQHYEVRYDASADAPRDMSLRIGDLGGIYFNGTAAITDSDEKYVHIFQASSDATTWLTFLLGGSDIDLCIDNVVMELVSPPPAVNLLENGGFWHSEDEWDNKGFAGGWSWDEFEVTNDNEACVDLAQSNASLTHDALFVEAGSTYELRFESRSDEVQSVEWALNASSPPYQTLAADQVAITSTMTLHTALVMPSETRSDAVFALDVNGTGRVCFDNITFKKQVTTAAPALVINELMASNGHSALDRDFGNYTDWIEIYNPTDTTIDASGLFISDKDSNPRKWELAAGSIIEPNGYLIVWADEEAADNHTSFKLSDNGETVTLYGHNEEVIDTVIYPELSYNVAYGRETDGGATWTHFGEGTAGMANESSLQIPADQPRVETPQTDMIGGLYDSALTITLSGAGTIYYTLDGSTPTRNAAVYSSPLTIDENTVVKAMAFIDGMIPSRMAAQTYLIGESSTLPVVSIGIAPDHLWDDEIGIYTIGTNGRTGLCSVEAVNWNMKWERPITVELYETDGSQAFSENAGTRVFGGCSRHFEQKSLTVYFRDQYGADTLDYQLFDNLPITQYDAFVLRNSGNDWQSTLIRDGMMQTLIEDEMDVDGQAYRPATVYINGEYWGIMNIREKINEDYLHWHHGVNPDDVDLVLAGGVVNEGSRDHYQALRDFIKNNDMTDSNNYAYIQTQMDVSQFVDYNIAQIYFGNTDWPSNNMKYWREQADDGRWRWITYDLDYGFELFQDRSWVSHDTLQFALATDGPTWPNPPWATFLFRKMMENGAFRAEFAQRMAAYSNTIFDGEHVVAHVDEIAAGIEPELANHIARWGEPNDWENDLDIVRSFAEQRDGYVMGHVESEFDLDSDQLDVTMNVSGQGRIEAHTVTMADANTPTFTAQFYRNLWIELRAVPDDGYQFVGWQEDISGAGDQERVVLNPFDNISVMAVFEPLPPVNQADELVINELHYNPADAQGIDEDFEFIEIYNAGTETVDLEGYNISDGVEFTFTAGAMIDPGEYIIVTISQTVYANNGVQVFEWVGGKLSNGGERVALSDAAGNVIDEVSYDDELGWLTTPDGDGPSLSLSSPDVDNDAAANWLPSTNMGGTPGMANDLWEATSLRVVFIASAARIQSLVVWGIVAAVALLSLMAYRRHTI